MENVFSLNYTEYFTIEKLLNSLKDKGNKLIGLIPTGRQNKGYDLVIHNQKKDKYLKIQVKGSRSYKHKKNYERGFKDTFWFNNFYQNKEKIDTDFFALVLSYPNYKNISSQKKGKPSKYYWKHKILIIPEKTMREELCLKFRLKRNTNKIDTKFDVAIDDSNKKIEITRGFPKPKDISKFSLENQIPKLKKRLGM